MAKTLQELVEKHGINIREENVTIAGKNGTITVALEDGTLDINVNVVDRVVVEEDLDIMELL